MAFITFVTPYKPIICGIADYAVDGETAWIVPPENPQALAEKIKEVIKNPEKAHKISEHARSIVERDRKSTRLNSSHTDISRMPSSA